MAIRHIVKDKCIGCKKCVDACPMDVLTWDDEHRQVDITNFIDCITCFNCELNCPADAMYVEVKRAKTVVFPW